MDDLINLKHLSQIIDVLRKKGVDSIEIPGLKLQLKDEAPASYYQRRKKQPQSGSANDLIQIENAVSDDDLLFWSSGGTLTEQARG